MVSKTDHLEESNNGLNDFLKFLLLTCRRKEKTRMKRFHSLLTLLCVLLCGPLQAVPYYFFEHYTTYEGLPSNTIHCTFQDRFGFIWVGTRDGMCRFDGRSFQPIEEAEDSNLLNLASMDLDEDEDGLLWFTTTSGAGYYDPFTGEVKSLGRLGDAACQHLRADRKGSVWFAGGKLFRYVKESGEIQSYVFASAAPNQIAIDSYDAVWVILGDGSLHLYNKRRDRFEAVDFPHRLNNIQTAENGRLLVSTDTGLLLLVDSITLAAETVFDAGGRQIRHILEREMGEFWIGTNDGLFVRHPGANGGVSEVFHHDRDPHSLSANLITSLSKDKFGNVWVGTYYSGLNVWQDKGGAFTIYYEKPEGHSMRGKIVRSIVTDPENNIWFCTEDGWLNMINPVTSQGGNFELVPNLNMQGLVMDGDDLWVSTFGQGVYLYDRKRARVRKHYDFPSSGCSVRTADGSILAGAMSGVYVYDPDGDRFRIDPDAGRDYVHALFEDSRGNLWIGTYGSGFYIRTADGQFTPHYTSDQTRGLTADRITSFFEDSRHRIWITTEGGGVCYTGPYPNVSDLQLSSLRRRDGMVSNVTCAIAEDEDGLLWVSSTHGITRIDAETARVEDFLFERQQILGSQFSYGAVCTTRGGQILMGNTNGMVIFSPAIMKKEVRSYPLYFTHIEARNSGRTVSLHENGRSVLTTERLRVRASDAALLSISFAAPEYSIYQQVSYCYSLLRGGREILSATLSDNEVNFAGLRPGRYRFDVGILGSATPISHKSLVIDVMPHPLWSAPAKILYFLLLFSLLGVFLWQLEMKRRRDRARHLSRLESQKQKEIYDAKINFFTNITHEIRTPLSLIKMPLDKLIAEKEYTPKAEKDMLTIQANADRLLALTNQLLDLRKMEKSEIKPVFLKEDLAEIVRKACKNFEQMAGEQNIRFSVELPEELFEVMCARDAVDKIVHNLLSNGIKYTQSRVALSLKRSPDGKTALLRVDSDGAMIPARESEKIFEIFYQTDDSTRKNKGTGLGLPYARTLAELHGGRLYLDIGIRKYNSFVLELPVEQETPIALGKQEQPQAAQEQSGSYDSNLHTLLIAEDSAEMRAYLASELSDEYNIVTAVNGQDAVEKLQQERIDLVVSDIMMPVMDGCQLCNFIKTNMDYSHLPVLLLTAAVGVETRLQTLEVGADGYIEKPFPIELLRANIANLFKNREISFKQFTDSPLTHFNSVNTGKLDEEFMEKLHGIVMKHMAEQDLSIETLTGLIGTSKSTLYRKVKANTGLNINEYIRLCRLKQAAEMLSSLKYRINEVAYMVGFSSPSYFATSFQKQFNISPSAFVKNLREE